MEWDDIIYVSLLLLSIAFGGIYTKLPNSNTRKWVGTAVGIIITVIVSGYHAFHPILLCILNILVLQLCKKKNCQVISLGVSFGYLLFFRLGAYIGIPDPPGHTNAILMIMVLKLVGLCCEVQDTWQLREDVKRTDAIISDTLSHGDTDTSDGDNKQGSTSASDSLNEVRRRLGGKSRSAGKSSLTVSAEELRKDLVMRLKYEAVDPSMVDVVHYTFSYCGLLTGPYFKYRVWLDSLALAQPGLQPLKFCLQRLKVLPVFAGLFLIGSQLFPLKFATSDEIFRDYNFLYRFMYMTPVFFVFRMRLYSGFVLSECSCIAAGVGAYPQESKPRPGKGPTLYTELERFEGKSNDDYNFETIHNIDEYGADFTPTVREGMRCWNMTVQYWLVTNIYKRVHGSKPLKEALTMLVSAYWHGMHSGYYLSMLTVPFILLVEDYYNRLIRRRLLDSSFLSVYDWITWFFKMQWFAYMGMAFSLLRVDTTLRYWHSIGYLGHGVILLMHGFAQFINLILGKAQQKLEKCRSTAFGNDTRLRVKSIPELEKQLALQRAGGPGPKDEGLVVQDKKTD